MTPWLLWIALGLVAVAVIGYLVRRWAPRPEEAGKPMVLIAVAAGVAVSLGLILMLSRAGG